ncbi:MAG: phosphoadenylyl-sulfate reductase [Cyanobacteriota bacterium]|nr:phosphoadenylyl-sulfate reductase [Cyanobacteriota bacterium]
MTAVLNTVRSLSQHYQPQVEALSEKFEAASPLEVLAWASQAFGQELVLACSFGPEDVVLIDMLSRIQPKAQAFFLDTDFHFPETLALKARIQERYPSLQLETVSPLLTPDQQAAQYQPELYKSNPDLCCGIRKVEPLNRTLARYQAWITGMRREQAPTRAAIGKVQWDAKRNLIKINPLADWTHQQIWDYIVAEQVPYNPLHDQNYPSIGCIHCTAAVAAGEDPRSGRWQGKGKTECGLHT